MLHQHERVPTQFVLEDNDVSAPGISLKATDPALSQPFVFHFEALRPNIFRTTFTSESHPLPPYPSASRLSSSVSSVSALDISQRTKIIKVGRTKFRIE